MTRPTANLRLFVGAYPPMDASRAMLRCLEGLHLPRHRMTAPEHLHLTLQFVGDVPARELESITESVERSVAGLAGFSLTPRRLVSLPTRGRPRLIAAETDSPADMLELQRRLAHRLADSARARPDDRFLPHFTLCRFAHESRADPIDAAVDLPAFRVDRIRLMRSTLRPDGAEHFEVRAVALL